MTLDILYFAWVRERIGVPREQVDTQAATVAEVVEAVEAIAPGFAFYVCDELGRLRQHVNVYVGDERLRDRATLTDPVSDDARVLILQALSGG